MSRVPSPSGAVLLAALLLACGGEPADGSAQVPAPAPGTSVAAGDLRACNLLTLEDATRVMGADTERPGGDTEQASCTYSRPGVAMMTLQLWVPTTTIAPRSCHRMSPRRSVTVAARTSRPMGRRRCSS